MGLFAGTRGILLSAVAVGSFMAASCRTSSTEQISDLRTMETSEALDAACQQETLSAELSDVAAYESILGQCLGSEESVRFWTTSVLDRMKNQWPKDYLAKGGHAQQCLEKLTYGTVLRYLELLSDACQAKPESRAEILGSMKLDHKNTSCFDFVRMTADGCFVVEACQQQNLQPKDFGPGLASDTTRIVACSESIQKIHKVKDPNNDNLLYNFAFVSELTGKQSYKRTTYGPPNCHGTAQAVVGGLLEDIKLNGYIHARTANESRCKAAVEEYLTQNRDKPISQLPMSPGGLLVNMKHEQCTEADCGDAKLWVDDCDSQKLELAVFIDGMCIACWEKKLAAKGFAKQTTNYVGSQLKAGCVLTTNDHSVVILGQSRGMCFYYEATSPFGPPQVRATPCVVLNDQFLGQYCSAASVIPWQSRVPLTP